MPGPVFYLVMYFIDLSKSFEYLLQVFHNPKFILCKSFKDCGLKILKIIQGAIRILKFILY